MTQQTTAVQTREESKIEKWIKGEKFKQSVGEVLPKHLTPERFVKIALYATLKNPKLKECDANSVYQALITLSQLGLEPDGRLAHLIPFQNRKANRYDCQLIVDFKGLAELAYRSGRISHVHADVVCDNDDFEYDRGQVVRHKIDFRKPRGNAYAYYAMATFKDGGEAVVVMTKFEVDAIRARSRAGNSGPWVTDYDEMAKKTAFRRLSKWLPLSPDDRINLDKADPVVEVNAAKPGATIDIGGDEAWAQLTQTTSSTPETTQESNATSTDTSDGSQEPADQADSGNTSDATVVVEPPRSARRSSTAKATPPAQTVEVKPEPAQTGQTPVAAQPSAPVSAPPPAVVLVDALVKAGITADQFARWAVAINQPDEVCNIGSYDDLPDSFVQVWFKKPAGLIRSIQSTLEALK